MNNKTGNKALEKFIIELYKNGMSTTEIQKKFRKGQRTISRILRENGVELHPRGWKAKGPPKTTTREQEEVIVDLYKSGLSKESIQSETGIGTMVVTRVLKDWGVKMRSCGGVRPYNVRSDCFDNLSDEYSAYWLGFLFAEASVVRTNLRVALSARDLEHLERLKIFFECKKPIRSYNVGIYPAVKLDISDRPLMDRLRNLGIEPHRPRGVELLHKIPKCSLNHFLRGWFDGDGSAYKFPQLSFAGRPPFLMEVQKVFIENAFANPITLKRKFGEIRVLNYRGVNRCNEISNYLYRDATIWLPRKRDRILSWRSPEKRREERFWGSS